VILINLVDTNFGVYLKFRNQADMEEAFKIENYDFERHIVKATSLGKQGVSLQFPSEDIEQIEFESHYKYRGVSAKILRVV
jgi:hypothetical protein